jgi:hypothetical protein
MNTIISNILVGQFSRTQRFGGCEAPAERVAELILAVPQLIILPQQQNGLLDAYFRENDNGIGDVQSVSLERN